MAQQKQKGFKSLKFKKKHREVKRVTFGAVRIFFGSLLYKVDVSVDGKYVW